MLLPIPGASEAPSAPATSLAPGGLMIRSRPALAHLSTARTRPAARLEAATVNPVAASVEGDRHRTPGVELSGRGRGHSIAPARSS